MVERVHYRNVLVTGISGFLGSAVGRRLSLDGGSITGLVRSPSHAPSTSALMTIRVGDLLDRASLDAALANGVDAVIHCAGAVGAQLRLADAIAINVDGTRNLLDAMIAHRVRRLVYVSSLRVVTRGNDERLIDETAAPLSPSGEPYGDSKIAAEAIVREAALSERINATIVRPGFVCGAGDRHFLPAVVLALRNNQLRWIESGHNRLDPLQVDDVAEGIVRALGLDDLDCVHLASTTPITARDLVTSLCTRANLSVPERSLSRETAERLFAHADTQRSLTLTNPVALEVMTVNRTLDLSRMRDRLGFIPSRSIDDAVAEFLAPSLRKTSTRK